jgi:hyperosmotically inducible periplasmic protein
MHLVPKTNVPLTMPALALALLLMSIGSCERQPEPPVKPISSSELQVGLQGAGPGSDAKSSGAAQLSDTGITARVKAALMGDDQVKGLGIHVETRDAAVMLTGNVDTDEQVTRAVAVARGVTGVREVVNRLSVKGEDKAERSNQG